ncbi:protein dcd1B-like [Mercenaria mercenaria]|uniref:protein dcd1B-like n=1 Tax=Mercenaria mercenaria TaxID=6596 RepID=UPI00234E7B84|nr:protein dcd1B-like [Mercenaria mercenaria]
MPLFQVLIFLGFCFYNPALAAYCHGKPDPNAQQNLNPIFHGEPRFVRQVKNGKLYVAGEAQDAFNVVHLWGTPYEMGYAHGSLAKEEAYQFINSVWNYLELQVTEAINGTVSIFKPWFLKDVADKGLDVALDLEIDVTRPYTGEYFFEEAKGLADATGLNYMMILRIHMIGELTKGDCSMMGAWGSALKQPGSLLQLRALDWNTDGPFKDFPQVTVYHPSDPKYGHAFANIGWTGWFGSITGFNSKQMAISEIGVSFPDASFKSESRFGIPFTYILRDVLQFDNSLADAMKRMQHAHRTCNLILGVGDGKTSQFRGIQYSASVANFYTDTDMQPEASWHPKIKDIVYYGMDWLCPGFSEVLARQLTKHHGNLSPDVVIRDVVSIEQSGSLHIAVYDLTNKQVYIANARGTYESGPLDAYDRTFVQLNTTALFAVQQPNADK